MKKPLFARPNSRAFVAHYLRNQRLKRANLNSIVEIPPSYDPDAVILFAAMTVQPDSVRKALYNDLIVGVKLDGNWPIVDVLHITAAHTSQAARLNIKNPSTFTATAYSGLTFNVDLGYSGGGTGYVDTGFNPATAGGQFTQNSGHILTYTNFTSADTANSLVSIGKASAVDSFIRPRSTSDAIEGRVNSGTNQTFGNFASRLGSRILSRVSNSDSRAFVNGLQSGPVNTGVSAAPASGNFTLFRLSVGYNTTDRIAASSIGGGLTVEQSLALHNRVTTFLTAIGAN